LPDDQLFFSKFEQLSTLDEIAARLFRKARKNGKTPSDAGK